MQNQKIVTAVVIAAGLLIWSVLGILLGKVFEHYDLSYGYYEVAQVAAPLLLAFFVVVILLRSETVINFLLEVVVELKKVTWPQKKETWSATFVVIVFVAIISFVLGAFDISWAYLIKKLLIAG